MVTWWCVTIKIPILFILSMDKKKEIICYVNFKHSMDEIRQYLEKKQEKTWLSMY